MKIYIRGFLVGLALLLAFAPIEKVLAQNGGEHIRITQVDNSTFPQVTIYVSVTNAMGEPLAVNPNQIQVFENGQLMQPKQIKGSGEIGISPLCS